MWGGLLLFVATMGFIHSSKALRLVPTFLVPRVCAYAVPLRMLSSSTVPPSGDRPQVSMQLNTANALDYHTEKPELNFLFKWSGLVYIGFNMTTCRHNSCTLT